MACRQILRIVSVLDINANVSDVSIVLVGSTATFSCHVNNSKKIMWKSTNEIFVNNELISKFAERHFVKHMNGKTDLTIENIQHCDAGSYECRFVENGEIRTCEFLVITTGKYNKFISLFWPIRLHV